MQEQLKEAFKELKKTNSNEKEVSYKNSKNKERTQFEIERPVRLTKTLILETGGHFGHKPKDWHPNCFKFLYGIHQSGRNKTHIINIAKTLELWPEVQKLISDVISSGKEVLFVGTKRQASAVIKEEAIHAGQPYVDQKWKGGTLTNFSTMKTRINRLREIDSILVNDAKRSRLVKKEILKLEKEKAKLEMAIGGIKEMKQMPGLVFIVDVKKEKNALAEAKSLGIPVLGLLDSNCNPDDLDYFLPINDDAYKSIKVVCAAIADTIISTREVQVEKDPTESKVEKKDS